MIKKAAMGLLYGEAVMPGTIDFLLGSLYDNIYNHQKLAGKFKDALISRWLIWWVEGCRSIIKKELARNGKFAMKKSISNLCWLPLLKTLKIVVL